MGKRLNGRKAITGDTMDQEEDYRTQDKYDLGAGSTVRKEARDYKCPKCKGEFKKWDKTRTGSKKCPFCGTRKGHYDTEEDE